MTSISPFGIRRAAFIAAAPARVWEEFTSLERMQAWYGTGHELTHYDAVVGGFVRTTWEHEGSSHEGSGRVLVFEPARELTFEVGWDGEDWTGSIWPEPVLVTILLTAVADGTIVELFHHGYERLGGDPAVYLSGFEAGWDTHHLDALAKLVLA